MDSIPKSALPTPVPTTDDGPTVISVVVVQSLTCVPMDCSTPGSSVHGISQARILEWVAISFSGGIFLTRGPNPHLCIGRRIYYPCVSALAGGFITTEPSGKPRYLSFVVVQLLSCVWLFATPWAAARQASLSFTISWSLLKFMSIESMKHKLESRLLGEISVTSDMQMTPPSWQKVKKN